MKYDKDIKNWKKISNKSDECDVWVHKNGTIWVDVSKLELPDFMLKVMGEAAALRHLLQEK